MNHKLKFSKLFTFWSVPPPSRGSGFGWAKKYHKLPDSTQVFALPEKGIEFDKLGRYEEALQAYDRVLGACPEVDN